MRILVDGYNVIRRLPELQAVERAEGLAAGREALCSRLRAYRRGRGHAVTVVFDGAGGAGESSGAGGLTVRFSRAGETADAVIARLLEAGGSGVVVVSSDTAVAAGARRAGAAAVTAEEFGARLETVAFSVLKGLEEESPPAPAKGKGPSRRPPKAERARRARLRKL
ncbi:MAG: NYN domain-containing protein [candidate division NC10 bacterium]|nr:NYN domain-containing protein [candidate division NC10 bacterium]